MSGLEVLGALAAASQLGEQGLKIINYISELYVKVQDAPNSIRKHKAQVEQLIEIEGLIKNNPPLQTDMVGSTLRVCSSEAEKLWKY
jgi:hypothetical protein